MADRAHAAAPPAWAGVWRGAIGKAAVQVCLQHEDDNDFGAYFYLRHLTIISLGSLAAKAKTGAPPVWTEAPFSDRAAKGPLWRLTTLTRNHLQGVWSGGGKTLPIDLVSVPMAKPASDDVDDGPCGNKAFSLPRFTQPVITTKPATLKGFAYTRVLADPGKQFEDSNSATFQLNGATSAIRRVNAALYKAIPTRPDNATYFTCSMEALGQNGLDGDASSTITPLIISRSWLVLQDSESDDCGGAHPNSDVSYQTWDLRTGVLVNLYDWFNATALKQTVNDAGSKDQYITVAFTAPFRKLIDNAYLKGDGDCEDDGKQAEVWDPRLTADGVAFTPELAHVDMACADDSIIPFAKLASYLSPAGKAGVASFLAEIKALK